MATIRFSNNSSEKITQLELEKCRLSSFFEYRVIFCSFMLIFFYRTTTESELDLDRVNGEALEEPDDPFGVLDALLQSQLPLRLCIISFMCWATNDIATVLSAPLGMITSACFFVGRQNSSNAGFTRVVYWCNTCSKSRPRSSISRKTLLANLVSASVSTNSFISNLSIMSL